MLKSIDILLGLSVVMLMVSLVVTVLTNAITNVLQTRGRNLLAGIASLLQQVHRELPASVSEEISKAVLTHPLIKSAGDRYGAVIHREELTALLLELASGDGLNQLQTAARTHLCDLLKANGITDPAGTMANVRALTLTLERAHPELSNQERYAMAFLQEANSRFLAKINGWFDQTIDRVADRFTNSTRIITFAGSFAVAFALQLDTSTLVNRLSADDSLRQSLVAQAVKLTEQAPPATNPPPTPEELQRNLQNLATIHILDMPASLSDWIGRWTVHNWAPKLLGILLTAMLLSLGAPFWYNALKNLVRLRSLIAQKDDDQRAARQTSTPISGDSLAASVPVVAPLVIAGERGDLASLG